MVVIDVLGGELRWADGVSCESAGGAVQPKVGGLKASKDGWIITQVIVLTDGLTCLIIYNLYVEYVAMYELYDYMDFRPTQLH